MNRHVFFTALLILLSSILVQSCTIEKRKYTGGFNVEWHHESRKTESPKTTMYEDRAETTVIAEENVAITTKVEEIASKTEEPIIAEENVTAQIENKRIPTFEPSKKKSITAILPLLNAAGSWTDIAHAEKSKKKKKGSMGTISGLFGALSWLAIIILIAIATKNPVTAGFAAIMSLAAFLFALMAMIFGGIAIKKAKKGAGRGGAILGITLSSIYFIFLLIGLILLL